MADTSVKIEVDGVAIEESGVLQLDDVQVEESAREADAASVTARLVPSDGGEWTSLLDALAAPRTPLAITVSRGLEEYRFDGRSTEVEWRFEPDGASRFVAKAVDRTVDMNVEEKVVDWSGNTDSQIAESILSSNGFATAVESTPDTADPDVHVVIQRATDWAFLRSLAAKWGYEVYLESRSGQTTGVFGPLDPTADSQADLPLGYGDPMAPVSVRARLLAGREVHGSRMALLSDEVIDGEDGGTGESQGTRPFGGESIALITPDEVDGEIDPAEAAKGMARRSAFGLRLDVEVDTDRVDTLLRARRTVKVAGLPSLLSGLWLVESTRHVITPDGHHQRLALARNAYGSGMGALASAGAALAGSAAEALFAGGSGVS